MFEVTPISDILEDGVRRASFRTCESVCSQRIDIELQGDTIRSINCHGRGTSCPDQLARALEQLAD